MLVYRFLAQTTKLSNFAMHARYYLIKRQKSVDLAYKIYENITTPNNLSPLIVMHGLFGSKKNWRGVCNQLQNKLQNRKIIAVDARNHGESPHTSHHRYEDMADDIVQLMEKESLKQACLLGHSMGGKCMMYTSLKYPHLIEKVVVVDISPLKPSASLAHMALILYALKQVKVSRKLELREARIEADKQLIKLNILNPNFRSFILTNFIRGQKGRYKWRFNLTALSESFTDIITFPTGAVYLKYEGPILFIGGADSDSISQDDLDTIQTLYFPSAQLIMLRDAGHLIHVDQPDILIDLIVKFLQ